MRRMIKFIWLVTIFLFLVVLLWVYAYLPSQVGVMADPGGEADTFISKNMFFYLSIGIFLLVNGVLFSLHKMLMPASLHAYRRDPVLSPKESLRADLASWMFGFAAVLNIFFILGTYFLSVFNNPEGLELSYYGLLVFAGPVLIVGMLLVLVYLFFKKR